jgi:hypothetical protein
MCGCRSCRSPSSPPSPSGAPALFQTGAPHLAGVDMSRFDTLHGPMIVRGLTGVHGETVTYTPSGEDAVSIVVVIEREGYAAQNPDGLVTVYPIVIHVSRGDVATVVRGKDTVALKTRPDDSSNTTYLVSRIIDSDGGMWQLGLTVQ